MGGTNKEKSSEKKKKKRMAKGQEGKDEVALTRSLAKEGGGKKFK